MTSPNDNTLSSNNHNQQPAGGRRYKDGVSSPHDSTLSAGSQCVDDSFDDQDDEDLVDDVIDAPVQVEEEEEEEEEEVMEPIGTCVALYSFDGTLFTVSVS